MTNADNKSSNQLGKEELEDESPTVWYSRNVMELMEKFQCKKLCIEQELEEELKASDGDKAEFIQAGKRYARRLSELQLAYTDATTKLMESWKKRMGATEELD